MKGGFYGEKMLAQNRVDGAAGPGVLERGDERAAAGLRDGNLGAGLPGGEALILPLIILLIYLGWQLGAMWREVQERFR